MLSRRALLLTSVACATGFVLVVALVALGWTGQLDSTGRPESAWAESHGLVPALRDIEIAFDRTAILIYAAVMAIVLLLRRQIRVAAFVVLTTCAATLVTAVLKTVLGRHRPPWQAMGHLLTSNSLPSGHATSVGALAATAVLVAAHVRRRNVVLATSVLGVAAVVVVAADRVMLGRHYPTDVIAGTLVGVGAACLIAMALGLAPTGSRQAHVRRVAARPMFVE